MLAGAGPFHGERAVDDPFVELLRLFKIGFAVGPDKNLAVEVAVADVAEKRYRHRSAGDIFRSFDDALREPRNRNAHVGRNGPRAGPQLQAGEISLVARSPEPGAVFRLGRPLEVHT